MCRSLPQDYLNVRGHVRANVMQVEGPGGGLTAVAIVMVTAYLSIVFSRLDPPADIALDVKRNTPNDGQQRPLFRLFRPSEIHEVNDVIRVVVGSSKSEAPSCHLGEGGLPVTVQNSYTPSSRPLSQHLQLSEALKRLVSS